VNISGVRPGDVVEVTKRNGVPFHAVVRGPDGDGLRLHPLSPRINYFHATAREITGHWRASKATRTLKGWS
jgi:hypothetical protein